MYQQHFGSVQQIKFDNESEYYELIGLLAKNDGSTSLAWEPNDEKGTAWGKEGRIQFHRYPINLSCYLKYTAGNGGNISKRVNCNEFIQNLINNHGFVMGATQNISSIRSTVPPQYHVDFDRGLQL
ncbi:hypothetical protein [Emticicia fontis]